MFEQRIEDATATVHVDERESRLADEHGVKVPAGTLRLTFSQASELSLALDRSLAAGRFCYAHLEKRLRGLRNSIVWAFGPEAEEAMRRSPNKVLSETSNQPRLERD